MDFLLLFNECVVLSNSSKSELIHEINFVGLFKMLVLYAYQRLTFKFFIKESGVVKAFL